MRYVEVDGVRLSVIGLGTWQFGSKEWGYGSDYAANEAGRILDRALDLGINVVDTAEIYGRGESERIVGRNLDGRRAEAFVATKVLPVVATAKYVEQHGRKSAERLGVSTIDLYQVHWPNPIIPISQQMEGMRRLQEAKIVTRVGVSNFSLTRWKAAERALGGPVFSNQVQYSLVARKPDIDLVPYAQAHDRLVLAYSPLGMGLLSGRYDADHLPNGSARLNNALFLPENLERARPLIDALREIAARHGATPAQVALAWVVWHDHVVAIPGASSVEQLEANAAAADLTLAPDEIGRLTEASDAFHPVRGIAAAPKLVKRRVLH
ncbi:MAG TPA: aldo/keto reductase [Acidimicrobiia bacterium]|jgi:aryl-alcohol dehydrogenase-like predicted oxidoreductase|nr:aldo/keto reductase [Acidimicrobiia bacterium]